MIDYIIMILAFSGLIASLGVFVWMLIVVLGCVLSVLIHVIKH